MRGATVATACVLSYAAVWAAHLVSTAFSDPLGLGFDALLWGVASVLKVLALGGLLFLLASCYRRMATGSLSPVRAFSAWAGTAVVLVLLLGATRSLWARTLSTSAVWYYDAGARPAEYPGMQEHFLHWRGAWLAGSVLGTELGLAVALALLHVLIGRYGGQSGALPPLLGAALTWVVLVLYQVASPWTAFDYDFFHGDIFSGALFMDLFIPFPACDPYATVALVVYLGVCSSSHVLLLLSRRKRPGARQNWTTCGTDRGTMIRNGERARES